MEHVNIVDDDIPYHNRGKIQVLHPDGSDSFAVELKKIYVYHDLQSRYKGLQLDQALEAKVITQEQADDVRKRLSFHIVEI